MKKINFKSLTVPVEKYNNGFTLISKYRSAIMGFSAIWIVIFHEWQMLSENPDGGFHFWNFLESRIKGFGFAGVDIFLLLSGIGLTFAIRKASVASFYYRRLKRIILPFLAMAIVRAKLDLWTKDGFIKNISGYNFYKVSIYSFLWFVPAIITLYIFFPIYWGIFKKVGAITCTYSAMTIWLLFTLYVRNTMRNDLFGFTNRIPIFLMGILYGWLTQNRKDMKFSLKIWIPILLTFMLGLYFGDLTNYQGMYLVVPVSNCCIPNFLMASTVPFILATILNFLESHKYSCIVGKILNTFLTFVGGFSLEIYCVQEWYAGRVLGRMYAQGWGKMRINVTYFIHIVVISFLASVAFKYFWKFVEYPFTAKKIKAAKAAAANVQAVEGAVRDKENEVSAEQTEQAVQPEQTDKSEPEQEKDKHDNS